MSAEDPNRSTNAQVIVDVVERLAIAEFRGIEDNSKSPFVVLPAGKRIESLKPIIDAFRTKPERRTGQAEITTELSFIDHVNRFKGEDTVIFADVKPESPSLTAVYDYNPKGADNTAAAFGRHRAKYSFPLSKEWKAWREKDGKSFTAVEFSLFLEDRVADVIFVDPDEDENVRKVMELVGGGMLAAPNQLQSLARSLQVNAGVTTRQAISLASGEINIQYAEVHDTADGDGKPIKLPNMFVLGIPVFHDGALYKMLCRLRYRLGGGQVTWWYTMVRPEVYFDHAIKDSVVRVSGDTELLALYGKPEGPAMEGAK